MKSNKKAPIHFSELKRRLMVMKLIILPALGLVMQKFQFSSKFLSSIFKLLKPLNLFSQDFSSVTTLNCNRRRNDFF